MKSGDPCGKCRMNNALVLRSGGRDGDYWACWSCGEVTEDARLQRTLPSAGKKFAAPGERV